MSRSLNVRLKPLFAAAIAVILGACGGGGGGSASAVSVTKLLPTGYTSEGRTYNTCILVPACSGNPYAPFTATLWAAPTAGATLGGLVRIEVHGYDMQNVELLPANAYLPRLGVFNITGDKTVAWLDLDTTKLPNGPLNVRVSAFDTPAGQAGAREIIVMPARTWNISNVASLATAFTATVTVAPPNGATVSGVTRLEVRGSGIANAELLPASGYSLRFGVFNVSADRTTAWLDFDSRSVPDGLINMRISAFNLTEGQPGATEIVAMPARQWNVANGNSSAAPFTARVTMAPVHGEIVSGLTRLEVRGSGMRNVELLPSNAYLPRLGVFNVDSNGTFAWLDFDTASLSNGPLNARISAFNVEAGQPNAREIIAMTARQWVLQH